MSTTARGVPFPLGTDANDAQSWLQQLAQWVNDRPGVPALTTTQRNALTGVDRWDGKLVLDTTLDREFRWDAGTSTWVQQADFADIATLLATSGTPSPLAATASRGVSSSAARADHAHALPAMTTYTPTWTATTTNPTLGNGTLVGSYARLADKWIVGRMRLDMGSTTTYGAGTYIFGLPTSPLSGFQLLGEALILDQGNRYYAGKAAQAGGTGCTLLVSDGATNVTPAAPFTFGSTDVISINFAYQEA